MADVRVRHEALDLEACRPLEARGHHDEAVVVEAPVAHAEAVEANLLAEARQVDEPLRGVGPPDGRQVPERELQPRIPLLSPPPLWRCLATRNAVSESETVLAAQGVSTVRDDGHRLTPTGVARMVADRRGEAPRDDRRDSGDGEERDVDIVERDREHLDELG